MISVIVPVYNIEKYIERCISSILKQTYNDFELLLINDGSTDSSYQICKQFEKKDPRIKVFSQNNSGVSFARNLGLDKAQGEFICFIDGDDWISPDYFEKLLSKMSTDIDLVSTDYQKPDENGSTTFNCDDGRRAEGVYSNLDCILDAHKKVLYTLVVWGKLYRKALWEHVRFKPFSYSEDTYALFEVLMNVHKIYILDEPLYYYFQRNSSVSHQRKLSHFEEQLTTLSFQYDKTQEAYPDLLPAATESLLSHCHFVLKLYCQLGQTKKAFALIEKMQLIYKNSHVPHYAFADRLLVLPKPFIYLYAKVKVFIEREDIIP